MSKNEIRLRREKLTGQGSERFRDFSVIKKRHEREIRMKKIIRLFTIVAAILVAIILFIAMQIILELRAKKNVKEPVKKESAERRSVSYEVTGSDQRA